MEKRRFYKAKTGNANFNKKEYEKLERAENNSKPKGLFGKLMNTGVLVNVSSLPVIAPKYEFREVKNA